MVKRLKLSYFSPLPPDASGIADYSAELLPALADKFDIAVFTASGSREVAGLPARSVDRFRPSPGEIAVYQIGNHVGYHKAILEQALRYPGVCVLHEYLLHHLVRGLTYGRGKFGLFMEEMRYAYGLSGLRAAERFMETGVPVDPWRFPLFERLVDASLGVIVHSKAARQRVLASRPLANVHVVPMACPQYEYSSDSSWFRKVGVPEGAPVVATFGLVTPHKRIDVTLRAFSEVARRHRDAFLVVVGEVSDHYDIRSLKSAAPNNVVWTGRLSMEDLVAAMASCDIAVNLRFPSGGETSGTAIRLMAMGKPMVVSDIGWFSEIPKGCVGHVPVGRGEVESLAAVLNAMVSDRRLASAMGKNAAAHFCERHTLEMAATAYESALQEILSSGPWRRLDSPPLAPETASHFGNRQIDLMASAAADLGLLENEPSLSWMAQVAGELAFDRPVESNS